MKISVITVCYNSGKYIQSAIESVISQSWEDIEYIVIDGGSKDATLDIIQKYKGHIAYFVSEPDSGIYEALNKGIKSATGDIIGILNADDFYANNQVLQNIAEEFIANQKADIIYGDVVFVDQNNLSKNLRYYSSKYFKPSLFRFGFMPAHPATYIRKKCFIEYGYYLENMKISSDYEFLLRLMYVKKVKSLYVNDLWVKMRAGGVSSSGFKSVKRLNAEILKACKINNIYTNYLFIYSKYLFKWQGYFFNKQT